MVGIVEALVYAFAAFLVPVVLVLLLFAYLAVRPITGSSSTSGGSSVGVGGLLSIEDQLVDKDAARYIESGVISDVAPEYRRSRRRFRLRSHRRDGIRVTVSVPTRDVTTIHLWFEIPATLTGDSNLVKFLQYHDTPLDNLTALIGEPIPVRFSDSGEWETAWVDDWERLHRRNRSVGDRLRCRVAEKAGWGGTRREDDA